MTPIALTLIVMDDPLPLLEVEVPLTGVGDVVEGVEQLAAMRNATPSPLTLGMTTPATVTF